jgi:hypothetical protein
LYAPLLKEVFTRRARQHLAEGADGQVCARAYAEQGKPDFVLAYLFLIEEMRDEEKRELFAHAYGRRALLSEQKAESFSRQFHRSFPLIKEEAQKDRLAAQHIRNSQMP